MLCYSDACKLVNKIGYYYIHCSDCTFVNTHYCMQNINECFETHFIQRFNTLFYAYMNWKLIAIRKSGWKLQLSMICTSNVGVYNLPLCTIIVIIWISNLVLPWYRIQTVITTENSHRIVYQIILKSSYITREYAMLHMCTFIHFVLLQSILAFIFIKYRVNSLIKICLGKIERLLHLVICIYNCLITTILIE